MEVTTSWEALFPQIEQCLPLSKHQLTAIKKFALGFKEHSPTSNTI